MSEIFISWSKERSRTFATALRRLMIKVLSDSADAGPDLGAGNRVVTLSEDLPKGGGWFSNLADLLEHARAGLICVTPENVASPWLLFEAGALIRCDVKVALFPILLDLPPAAMEGPLALVQATMIERDRASIKQQTFDLLGRVCDHVNQYRQAPGLLTVRPLPSGRAAGADASNPWNAFATAVLQIPPASVVSIFSRFPKLFERKTFQEPFQDCADQRWLERYAGARSARDEMERQRPYIDVALSPGARLAYDRLSAAVDSYAMAIGGQLLQEREFGRDEQGHLTDLEGRLAVCERRRKAIHAAYIRLSDPVPPVFDDARTYEELVDLEERKTRLIHPLEHRLDGQRAAHKRDPSVVQKWQLRRAATSPWLYDRLVFYAHGARATKFPSIHDLLDGVQRELSVLEARDALGTLVGLCYALEAMEKRGTAGADRRKLSDLLDRIDARIEEWNRPLENAPPGRTADANRKIGGMVARLRTSEDCKGTPTGGDHDHA